MSADEEEQEKNCLATVQEDADYSALERYQHGEDMLQFSSLAELVSEQLAGRAERIAKACLTSERSRLNHDVPSWRYTLSQDLKDKLLKSISNDFLIHTLEVRTKELQGAIPPSTSRLLQSGRTGFSSFHDTHEELLGRHKDGRAIIGYLFRLPFNQYMLADDRNQHGVIEVRLPTWAVLLMSYSLWHSHTVCFAVRYQEEWSGNLGLS
jgi:hypothetical protein